MRLGYFKYGKLIAIFILACAAAGVAQNASAQKSEPAKLPVDVVASSPAYAEVLLRKTELSAELESLVMEYTDDYPKVKEIRFTLEVLQKESGRLAKVKGAETAKLTLALGKLIVRKTELETDLWNLLRTYKDDHPDVKRAKRKVEIYESAIKEILG